VSAGQPPSLQNEAVREFAEVVEQRFDRARISSFWTLEGPFRQLVDGGLAAQLSTAALTRMLTNNTPGDWVTSQIVAHRAPAFALSLMLLNRSPQLETTSWLGMYSPIGRDLVVDVYSPPPGYRIDVFEPDTTLKYERTETIPAGGIFRLRGDRYIYDYQLDEPLPALKISTSSIDAFRWTFDRHTLGALRSTDSEALWPQVSMAAELLADIADPSSIPALQKLATYPHPFVRWHAIQSLHRVDPAAALPLIEREASSGRHPQVRAAAAEMLASLEGKTT
jgi:hypothetical protein